MAKGKRRRKQKGVPIRKGLGGPEVSRTQLALAAGSYIGGAVLGATIGQFSCLTSLAAIAGGIYTKNIYITSAGVGLFCSPYRKKADDVSGVEGVEGFSVKQMTENAKNYFENIGSKFKIGSTSSASNAGTSGLGEGEEVNYFINPYSNNDQRLDLSKLDQISEQVAKMSQVTGPPDVDPVDRNF